MSEIFRCRNCRTDFTFENPVDEQVSILDVVICPCCRKKISEPSDILGKSDEPYLQLEKVLKEFEKGSVGQKRIAQELFKLLNRHYRRIFQRSDEIYQPKQGHPEDCDCIRSEEGEVIWTEGCLAEEFIEYQRGEKPE